MQLTRAEDYGFIFLSELAKHPDKFISGAFIAEQFQISPLYLNKITGKFREKGILEGKEGHGGGYRLRVDPKKITLKKILEALGGEVFMNACNSGCNKVQFCGYQKKWEKLNRKFVKEFEKITLKEFIEL